MALAFVSVGSNIDPEKNVSAAVKLLASAVHIRAISTVYATPPWEQPGQPDFYNCVISVETPLPPLDLKHTVLRRIETELGRVRSEDKSAPRTIDLDLILYDDVVLKTEELILPDPEIRNRPFLAGPLYELAPNLIMPDSREPLKAIAARVRGDLKPLFAYSERLQKEIKS
jgi:2-amino-4-hydroxy-6-hydroxymethyldihydropteridine diphosphokinase